MRSFTFGKRFISIIQKTFEEGSQNMGLVFHKLHITEHTVGVPNHLLYLQIVLKDIP